MRFASYERFHEIDLLSISGEVTTNVVFTNRFDPRTVHRSLCAIRDLAGILILQYRS
jgi:hypothetical protein